MKKTFKIVAVTAALILVGAGCSPKESPMDGAPTETEGVSTGTVTETADVAPQIVTNVAIDETWKTYVNASLGFEFKWPTKGRHAPLWDVSFVAEGDDTVMNGCRVTSPVANDVQEKVMVGDVEFCHTFSADAKGSTDYYVTKNGPRFIVITFTKTVASAGQATYAWDEYRTHLDQIVSTFRYAK